MSKQLYYVTDIRLIEPVEGTEDNHPVEELERFKEHVSEVITKMVSEDVTVEVVVSVGYIQEDGEENGEV